MAMIDSDVRPGAAPDPRSVLEDVGFERLLLELSARFINLPAEHVDSAVEEGLRRIVTTLGVDRSTLNMRSPLTGRVQVTHSVAINGVSPLPTTLLAGERAPWALARASANLPSVFACLDDLPPEASVDKETWRSLGLKSHVTMPIMVAGTLHGALSFGCVRSERSWPDELLTRLRLVAEIFGSALARKRAQEELENALAFERLLADVSASVLRIPSPETHIAIEKALQAFGEFLGVDRAAFWNMQGASFELAHAWVAEGVEAPAASAGRLALPTLFERLARGQVVNLSDIEDLPEEANVDKQCLRDHGTRALLAVPLQIEGRVMGALSFVAVHSTHVWPEALVPRVRLIGEAFASVLSRERAAKQVREAQVEAAQSRERLAHLARVYTLGEMSAAIAHEVNQPLVAIENYAQAARRRLASDRDAEADKVDELLGKIRAQAARAGDVIQRLRATVKRHDYEVTRLDLGQLVTGAVRLAEIESNLTELQVQLSVMREPVPVIVDEIQIQQVVLNLIRNAIEAMVTGQASGKALLIEVAAGDEGYVAVRVVDNGPGIAPGDEERIFEPFYTTKAAGLGIGLAVCRSIAESHGGRLLLVPHPGGGAAFEFTLPIADAED